MNSHRKKKLIKPVFLITAAIFYLIFAESIAAIVSDFADELYYPRFPKMYSNGLANGEVQIHVIDVGQGDSILIISNDGSILIDAGTSASGADIVAHLTACGVRRLDYFICTHAHDDHLGGARCVIDNTEVECILMSDTYDEDLPFLNTFLSEADEKEIKISPPNFDKAYVLGDITFEFLAAGLTAPTENDSSLILKLTHKDKVFLFMGDSGSEVEGALLNIYSRAELDCDFLKVGHHGAFDAASEDFLAAVTPDVAAISCGRRNSHGHPSTFTLNRLKSAGCDSIVRTDTMGTVVIRSDGQSLSVLYK